ncbi:hypothetical protein EVAR_24359_1 [Eumeta japonica]|uniref:Uncharacterized protein n=1 Tax=Eumeta variegata TaxID=151549 RepID=A0A4C1Y952_EUMVA|nr:hypothetical protein EVAR_24359_1 [Eumeta japonica]
MSLRTCDERWKLVPSFLATCATSRVFEYNVALPEYRLNLLLYWLYEGCYLCIRNWPHTEQYLKTPVEIKTSLHSMEPLRETLCPPELRGRFDSLVIWSHCILSVRKPLSWKSYVGNRRSTGRIRPAIRFDPARSVRFGPARETF